MKLFTKGLDTETQLLVAVGSAVAAGCIPCRPGLSGIETQSYLSGCTIPGLKNK